MKMTAFTGLAAFSGFSYFFLLWENRIRITLERLRGSLSGGGDHIYDSIYGLNGDAVDLYLEHVWSSMTARGSSCATSALFPFGLK